MDSADGQLERGELVSKEVYDSVAKAAGDVTRELEKTNKRNVELSRLLDLMRVLIMIGTLVVMVMLIIVVWVPGSSFDIPHKEFVIMLLVVCAAFILALWVARKNVFVLLGLMLMGEAVFMFGLGFAICGVRKLIQ